MIPSQIVLPYHEFDIQDRKLAAYIKELIVQLERAYETTARNVNGDIRSDQSTQTPAFTPTIRSSNNDQGTITYTHQTGWVFRQGLLVDVWFDVQWSAASGTPTGNLILDLPYEVANSSNKPFVGTCQASNITFTNDYAVCNATPDTRELTFWDCASATATAQIAFDSSGQVIGHVRYIGKAEETT
jgi:hypothetical protein